MLSTCCLPCGLVNDQQRSVQRMHTQTFIISIFPLHHFAFSFSGDDRMTGFNPELFKDMEENNTP